MEPLGLCASDRYRHGAGVCIDGSGDRASHPPESEEYFRADVSGYDNGDHESVVASSVTNLRQDLSRIATRGLSSVYDPTPAALTGRPAAPSMPAAPTPSPMTNPVPQADPPAAQPIANGPPADWTATSLTIQVAP
ncbi:MAG: hypothetical protein U0231_01215 [Nitrospiraceae bacterium]